MMDEIVAKFSDAHFLAMLFAAVGSAATVLTAAMPWLQPDTLSRRIKAVSSERERIRARERERLQASQSKSTFRVKPTGLVKQLVETLNLSSWLSTERAKIQLAMAGFRGAGAEYAFLAFRLAVPIAFFVAAIVYEFLIIRWDQRLFSWRRDRCDLSRHQGTRAVLAEQDHQTAEGARAGVPQHSRSPLDLRQSGMSIEHGVSKVGQEIGIESVSMAEEMGMFAAEMSYLAERRIAFENLGLRTGLEVRSVAPPLSSRNRRNTARRSGPRFGFSARKAGTIACPWLRKRLRRCRRF